MKSFDRPRDAPISASTPIRMFYGALNLALAAGCAYSFIWLIPSRWPPWPIIASSLVVTFALGGVGFFVSRPWGRILAIGSAVVLLASCAVLMVLLVASAAYLHAIYGGVGQAGAALALVIAALVFEITGIVPLLHLAHFWRNRER